MMGVVYSAVAILSGSATQSILMLPIHGKASLAFGHVLSFTPRPRLAIIMTPRLRGALGTGRGRDGMMESWSARSFRVGVMEL
ncbi:hypothetical protein KC19_4G228900 [Ceratodon purpureus]|uniref:Uncharacterized protein n=1 Tax=Ceratodon purpureus TaxID=3225 RepID=A0A8T0IDU0_CERPU|nr:hypothetical protein KC19_4G228900 [Ceratodon purpureus]